MTNSGQPKRTDEKTWVSVLDSIRELVINAARRAEAYRVDKRLDREADDRSTAIEDHEADAKSDASADGGIDSASIPDRMRRSGWKIRIESAPRKGRKTRLCASLPIKQSKKARVDA